MKNKHGVCPICERERELTFHHLIPKTCHSNKWFKKRFSKQEMTHSGIDLCRPCHSFIHQQFDEKVLGRDYHSLNLLLADEGIQKYAAWAKKQK